MWAFLPIILNLFMVLGMLLAFYNSLDITKVLAFSVLYLVFSVFLIFIRVKFLKIRFFVKKPEINHHVKKVFQTFVAKFISWWSCSN